MRILISLAASVLVAASQAANAQALDTLRPAPAPERYQLPPETPVEAIVVKFHEGTSVRLSDGRLAVEERTGAEADDLAARDLGAERVASDIDAASRLLATSPAVDYGDLAPAFTAPDEQLRERRASGERRSGRRLADLTLYFSLPLAPGTVFGDVAALVAGLNALGAVEIAYALPEAMDPQADVPPPTPDFEMQQGYLDPAPVGIDARYAWTVDGGTGTGVRIIDVEQGWNETHEALPPLFNTGGGINPGSRNHGTAVLGVMVAADNGYGVTGISHGAEAGYESHFGSPTDADAFNNAAAELDAGDVIIIEIQRTGPANGQSCPAGCNACAEDAIAVEYWQANFDVIETATANGFVVVEAGGNGASDYDDPAYGDLFDRATRDSGAILVGAGTSNDHGPTCFTNWGDRIDVQGWGQNVVTLGYGNLFDGVGPPGGANDEDQRYISTFNGTSAASPIIAGAAASVQGAVLAAGLPPLTSIEMREALRAGGTPQAPDARNIGSLPNLHGAIDAGLHPVCAPPAAGEWIVDETCVVVQDTTTPGDVEIRDGASLIVLPNVELGVDLAAHRILVQADSRLLVRQLGRVE